jgi:hypothetical protein
MREPEVDSVIRLNTAYSDTGGYTYVAFRTAPSDPGDPSWYPTGIQQSRNPIYADMDELDPQEYFPFAGIVTWQQILDFAGSRKIEIATVWETHPDSRRVARPVVTCSFRHLVRPVSVTRPTPRMSVDVGCPASATPHYGSPFACSTSVATTGSA